MRKIITRLTAIAAIVALAFTLTSCGGLSGTYAAEGGDFSGVYFNDEPIVSIEFKAFGDAEIVTGGWMTTTYEDGSYQIDGDQITLGAKWDYTGRWEGTYSYSEFYNDTATIIIDGHPFIKS